MPLISLPDGRDLEVEVTGPDGGPVILFHHGTPGGSGQLRALAREAHARGHRLVTTSRAGYGASTRRAGRSIADVVPDAVAVLDHVGVDTCLVAGWSGGGPHALACGALLPDRVRGVLCIAGVAPYDADGLDFLAGMGGDNIEEFGESLKGEEPLRAWLDNARPELVDVSAADVAASLGDLVPPVDEAVITGELAEDLAAQFQQAVSVGVDGWLDDDLAFTRPWGFDLGAITVPTYVWQGSEDLMVPFAHGRWLVEQIPGVTPHLEQGEGHLSIALGSDGPDARRARRLVVPLRGNAPRARAVRSASAGRVGQDAAGHRESLGTASRHGRPVVGERHHGQGQGPPAGPQPGRVVGAGRTPERLARRRVEEVPRDGQVDGRVPDGEATEVQDRGEPAVADQEVLRHQVPVVPVRLPGLPGAGQGQRLLPQRGTGVEVEVEGSISRHSPSRRRTSSSIVARGSPRYHRSAGSPSASVGTSSVRSAVSTAARSWARSWRGSSPRAGTAGRSPSSQRTTDHRSG